MAGKFGSILKELRLNSGQTLREFCERHGFDPGNYSRIERGLVAPPQVEKLREYANALGVEIGTDLYLNLCDAASVDRGELPHDLLTDAQIVEELPVLFRTLRGKPIEEDKLEKLIELLRKR